MSILLDERADQAPPGLAERTVLLDDDNSRVTLWRFQPGDQTGWHNHNLDYITVQQSGGCLELENRDGDLKRVGYQNNRTVAYQAPIEHNATNVSDEEVRVLEIEIKK